MAKPFYRLQRFLRRTQLLFLFLGVAYIMAGSVLLLQRAALVVSQRGLALSSSFLPLPSLPAPPRALVGTPVVRAFPVGARLPGSAGRYQASRSEDRAGPQWLLSRNQEIRQLRRRWFHSLMSEQDMTRADPVTARRKAPHKGAVRTRLQVLSVVDQMTSFLHHRSLHSTGLQARLKIFECFPCRCNVTQETALFGPGAVA